MAMRVVTGVARVTGATELIDVKCVHIDSCLFHRRSGIDFVGKLVDAGARVRVPTTNVGSVNLRRPERPARSPDMEHVNPLLGYLVGQIAGTGVPVLTGLGGVDGVRGAGADDAGPVGSSRAGAAAVPTEDDLKALGAAAASSGGVALFHIEGVTPECGRLSDVCDPATIPTTVLTTADLVRAQNELTTATPHACLDAICLGTPHASLAQLRRIARRLRDHDRTPRIPIWVNTGRYTADALAADHPADHAALVSAGVRVVTDTCTYLLPRLHFDWRVIMTDSAKWAHYGPGTMGVQVVFASLEQCVQAALEGGP